MSKVWKICSPDQKPVADIDTLVDQLLENRGIKTTEEREDFFHPQLSFYEKDLDIPNIAKAKKRILQAIKNQELIIVYGDYDVDGICATAILYHGLTSVGVKVLPYIPHREKEGYGLSKEGLDQAKEKGAGLVITVDNGIVALEQAEYAQKLGLDLIITDHHTPLDKKPKALAIVHSTKMCGAAVGWCLVRQMVSQELAAELLDLVALATVGDLVPLISVNRALLKAGLEKLNKTSRIGLLELIWQSGLKLGSIGAYEVGHILCPRINAIGRLEHSIEALRLLCTADRTKARVLAGRLGEANDQKKKMALDAIFEVKEKIPQGIEEKKILLFSSKNWIPGVIGLVAGRVAEEYHLPTVVIAEGELHSKGSARSVNGLNIIETLRECKDILLDVGGHPGAAGFTIETSKIGDFEKRLSQIMQTVVIEQNDQLEVEAVIDLSKVSKSWIEGLSQFEPFGMGNRQPVLAALNLQLTNLQTVGEGKHLKFKVSGIDAIAFSKGGMVKDLSIGQKVDLAFYLELNRFNGSEKFQLKVLDIVRY